MIPRAALALCLGLTMLMPGCGTRPAGLNVEKDVEVEGLSNNSITVGPVKSEQRISVLVRTSAVPIDVYVVLEKDRQAAMDALAEGKAVSSPLAKKEKVTEAALDARIPAGNEFAVLLSNPGNKTAKVALKITENK
jgi:hypothetical protein